MIQLMSYLNFLFEMRMLKINNNIEIGSNELTETFIRASGPGGQRVNKVETKVELRFSLEKSINLSSQVKLRIRKLAGKKLSNDGVLVIKADKYRSQNMNRNLAREKLKKLILRALIQPDRRLQTQPSNAVKVRRGIEKSKRSSVKVLRRRVQVD